MQLETICVPELSSSRPVHEPTDNKRREDDGEAESDGSLLEGDRGNEQTFYNVVNHLFAEMTKHSTPSSDRVLYLFMAMLKLMIRKEIEQAKRLEDVFQPETSRAFHVSGLLNSVYVMDRLASLLFIE